jgi:hypothetical protein
VEFSQVVAVVVPRYFQVAPTVELVATGFV